MLPEALETYFLLMFINVHMLSLHLTAFTIPGSDHSGSVSTQGVVINPYQVTQTLIPELQYIKAEKWPVKAF